MGVACFPRRWAEVDSSDVVGVPWNESMQWSSRAQVNLSIIAPILGTIWHLKGEFRRSTGSLRNATVISSGLEHRDIVPSALERSILP